MTPVATAELPYSVLSVDGETSYVLVPVRDFRQAFPNRKVEDRTVKDLFTPKEIRASIKTLENPDTQWYDIKDAKAMLVASDLIAARKAKGLTQKQLGDLIGVPQSQISRIERNPDHTTVRMMKKIAKALKVDVGSLL